MVTGAAHRLREGPAGRLSLRARSYVAGAGVVAALVVAREALAVDRGAAHVSWPGLVVLALLFGVCDSIPTSLTSGQPAWSPSSPATLAAVVLLGPAGAVFVGAMSLFSVLRGLRLPQRAFNASMFALSAYVAGETYLLLGGRAGQAPGPGAFPAIIGPFAAAAVVHVLINYGMLWLMLALAPQPAAPGGRSRGQLSTPLLLAADLGYATLGLLMAALWTKLGGFAAVLVLVPLFVARWAMGQFAAQERAYAATMAALSQAVETKDFYTRGHSERVARGAAMLAREVGMRPQRVEAIRFAGMLHDVGKLGVPTKVLQKDGPLTEEEYAAIQLHPMRGLEIVREIGFLDEALNGIYHHHERIDGLGYPMGLAGDEIPEFARVIAVADAFDAMTSNRSYRGARSVAAAVADLRKWSGTQFDEALVEAFISALERYGWPDPQPPLALPGAGAGLIVQDHDDPTAPLRVVDLR